MIPIIAYNYGAGHKKRITDTIRMSILIAIGIMVIGLIIFQTIPGFLMKALFNASEHMLSIGEPALRIISLSFLFAGFCIVAGSVFQALGNGVYSLLVSAADSYSSSFRSHLSLQAVRITYGMVGYPDCRDRFRNPVCTAVKANLPNKGKAFGEPIIQDKKTFA